MQYNERIKELRLKAKLTQKQVAEVLEMKQQQYQRWESGENEIPIKGIIRLAEFFGVSTDYILLGKRDSVPEDNEEVG